MSTQRAASIPSTPRELVSRFFYLLNRSIGQCLHLSVGIAVANNKIIRYERNIVQVQSNDLDRFLIIQRFDDLAY